MAPGQVPLEEQQRAISAARAKARRAAFDLARDAGATAVARLAYRGADYTVQDVELLPGLRAARDIELGARHAARAYLRDAREAGHSWQDIGIALGVTPGADPDQVGDSLAEAAYTYAAGHPDSETAHRYGRSFSWRCPSCDGLISDRGLSNGPADDELGHGEFCERLAATVAAWEADREAGQ